MQTRKRAKSISFGKPEKSKETTHHEAAAEKPKAPVVLETHEVEEKEHVLSSTLVGDEKAMEKAGVVERRVVPDKPAAEEETPPPTEVTQAPVVTPSDEFLTDTQPTATTITEDAPKPVTAEPVSPSPDVTQAPVTPEPEATGELSAPTEELSSTPPPSAFTIQGNSVETATDTPEGKKKHFVLYFIVIALLAFTLGLGAMAAVTYGFVNIGLPKQLPTQWLSLMKPAVPPTPTVAPSAAPTVAPTEKVIDLKAYTVSVLNGSGVTGKAADVKATLTAAGFKVGTTGNADRKDYTSTQITAKKTVDPVFVSKLEAELKKSFTVETTSSIPSTSSSQPDVVVTIGKAAAK